MEHRTPWNIARLTWLAGLRFSGDQPIDALRKGQVILGDPNTQRVIGQPHKINPHFLVNRLTHQPACLSMPAPMNLTWGFRSLTSLMRPLKPIHSRTHIDTQISRGPCTDLCQSVAHRATIRSKGHCIGQCHRVEGALTPPHCTTDQPNPTGKCGRLANQGHCRF